MSQNNHADSAFAFAMLLTKLPAFSYILLGATRGVCYDGPTFPSAVGLFRSVALNCKYLGPYSDSFRDFEEERARLGNAAGRSSGRLNSRSRN